jgi:hypothetical protein
MTPSQAVRRVVSIAYSSPFSSAPLRFSETHSYGSIVYGS